MRGTGRVALGLLLALGTAAAGQGMGRFRRVGIQTATRAELEPLLAALRPDGQETVAGRTFFRGMLEGSQAVLVEGGVGKANAALTATLLVSRFQVDLLLFSGVGGGLEEDLALGDVVVSSRVVQGDYVKIAAGRARSAPLKRLDHDGRHRARFLAPPPRLLAVAVEAGGRSDLSKVHPLQDRRPRARAGTITTQDAFVTDPRHQAWLRKQFQGSVAEMEGAAAAQAARAFGVPWLVFRGVSDHTRGSSSLLYPLVRPKAARNAALVLLNTLFDLQGAASDAPGFELPPDDLGPEEPQSLSGSTMWEPSSDGAGSR